MTWTKRLACRVWGHQWRLLTRYSGGCIRCGWVKHPDPREDRWHYSDLAYICGATTPAGPCYAEAPTPDGACTNHEPSR